MDRLEPLRLVQAPEARLQPAMDPMVGPASEERGCVTSSIAASLAPLCGAMDPGGPSRKVVPVCFAGEEGGLEEVLQDLVGRLALMLYNNVYQCLLRPNSPG